jgi:hypothetical protein
VLLAAEGQCCHKGWLVSAFISPYSASMTQPAATLAN